MALWGAEVKPGQVYVHKPSQVKGRLRITRATLGSQNNSGWSNLEARVGREMRATLCSLNPMSKPTCSLDLELEEDKAVIFSVNGQNTICLLGYHTLTKPQTCTVSRPTTVLKSTHQEMPDSGKSKKARREDVAQASGRTVPETSVQDGKLCHDADHESDDEEWEDGTQRTKATPPPSLHSKKIGAKKPNGTSTSNKNHQKGDINIQLISDDEKESTSKAKEEEEEKLKVECITKGHPDAVVATIGNKVRVKFAGHLGNGKVFDKGASFQFELGAGEMIPGWELGIAGMSVGEERRLTIPPRLGYGGLKQDRIPPNSWLIYTIKLLGVE